MPPTDPRYEALRERFPDILPETDDDPALTRLVRDLDLLMQTPAPTRLLPVNGVRQAIRATEATEQIQPDDAPISSGAAGHSGTGRQRRFGALIATVAAALVVALLAGALLTRVARIPDQTSVGRVHYAPPAGTCAPGDITAHLPANSSISDLDMVSPDEGWAVGAIADPAKPPSAEQTLILHYAHCAWAPTGPVFPGGWLSGVSMSSPGDGWIVGSGNGGVPLALHYSNGVWQRVTPAPGADLMRGGGYSSVRMLSADEGWITYGHPIDSSGLAASGLLHLSHGHWSAVNVPIPVAVVALPVAPDDLWLAGYPINPGPAFSDMYHYQAGTWTKTPLPEDATIYTMRMVTPNNIWASGQISKSADSSGRAATLHYDGSQWREVAIGASQRSHGMFLDVQVFDQNTAWVFTEGVPPSTKGDTTPSDHTIVTGAQYQRAGVWRQVSWPFTDLSTINSVTRVSSDEYWAVGYYTIEHRTPTSNGAYISSADAFPVLLYFVNGVWHEYGRSASG